MVLGEIDLPRERMAPPPAIAALLEESERRREEFYAEGLGLRFPKYVPSDPLVVAGALEFLRDSGELRGRLFCEWGCGFGIATGIASLLGFEAVGLEVEEDLAERAVSLHRDLGIESTISNESYLPDGYDIVEAVGGRDLVLPSDQGVRFGDDPAEGYQALHPAEVDLFFIYPHPEEEEAVRDLFTELAEADAVLLMYQGEGEISAWRRE